MRREEVEGRGDDLPRGPSAGWRATLALSVDDSDNALRGLRARLFRVRDTYVPRWGRASTRPRAEERLYGDLRGPLQRTIHAQKPVQGRQQCGARTLPVGEAQQRSAGSAMAAHEMRK